MKIDRNCATGAVFFERTRFASRLPHRRYLQGDGPRPHVDLCRHQVGHLIARRYGRCTLVLADDLAAFLAKLPTTNGR